MKPVFGFVAAAALTLVALGSAAVAAVPDAQHAPHASHLQSQVQKTARIVVRPVDQDERPIAGWKVKYVGGTEYGFNCYAASPAALRRGIEICGTTADNTPACWRGGWDYEVLCVHDIRRHVLYDYMTSSVWKSDKLVGPRTPLSLTLANGMRCSLRIGGAVDGLPNHPNWAIAYFCPKGKAVWATPGDTDGVNRAHQLWSVLIARDDGKAGRATRVGVRRAVFVGIAHRADPAAAYCLSARQWFKLLPKSERDDLWPRRNAPYGITHIRCAGHYATASLGTRSYAYVGVAHWAAGHWHRADRPASCSAHKVPVRIYPLACVGD